MAEVLEEVRQMVDMGLPIAAINLVGYLKSVVSVVCMARLGGLELAGGALAIGFTNITGYSVLSGLAMGMEPICGQALGSHNLSLATLNLHRTIFLLLCASAPIALLWINLEPIMLRLHQDADITRVAALYCVFTLPDLVANSLLHPVRIYLRCKGSIRPLMWCTALAVLFHIPLAIFLAFALRLGVAGVAIAGFCTNFNTLLLLLFYMTEAKSAIHIGSLPSRSSLIAAPSPFEAAATNAAGEEWMTLLRLAVPSCIGVCLEWWWYELMTLLAGYLPNPHHTLAAAAVLIQTTSLLYTLPMSLSAAVSTKVAKELGADRPNKAKLAAAVALTLAALVSLLGLIWTTLGRNMWGRMFTSDQATLNLIVAVLPIVGLCELANCPQTAGCGVLRGAARPAVGAAINFYSFYLVGAPVALVLAFLLDLGFMGLCYGLLAAQITCATSIGAAIYRTNWEGESLKARDLVGRDGCGRVLHGGEEVGSAKNREETVILKSFDELT